MSTEIGLAKQIKGIPIFFFFYTKLKAKQQHPQDGGQRMQTKIYTENKQFLSTLELSVNTSSGTSNYK